VKSPLATTKIIPIVLWALILFGSVERIITPLQYNPYSARYSDPRRHWAYAVEAFREQPVTAADNIGYQVWLAAVSRVTDSDPLAIGLYSGLLSVLTGWIWYRFFREILESKNLALTGWAIIACLPSWLGIYSYFMTETLFLPLLGLALWFTFRSGRRRTLESFVWAAIFWLMASLTRQIALPLACLCLLWLLRIHEKKLQKLAILCLLCVSFFLPVAYRNYRCTGVFSPMPYKIFDLVHLLSGREQIDIDMHKTVVHYAYNFKSPSTYDEPFAPFSDWSTFRTGNIHVSINLDNGVSDWLNPLKESWQGPQVFAKIWLENVIFLFFGTSWPDRLDDHFWESIANNMRWLWAPLTVFCAIRNMIYFKRNKRFEVLPSLVMFAWLICIAVPYVIIDGRYRKPLEGLLIANVLWLMSPRKIADRPGTKPSDSPISAQSQTSSAI
jgi:hypothetical protein